MNSRERVLAAVNHQKPDRVPIDLSAMGASGINAVVYDMMKKRAGVFVSLHRRGELRGCIGTIDPVQDNVAEEIIRNAISASTEDPRFSPLQPRELEDLEISVDVLTVPEPIESEDQLDPRRYGVIVRKGAKRGLLLPDLQGVDTAAQQVEIARRKAWIGTEEPVKLFRFEVIRYH